jgi:hypothetical protein
MSIKFLSLTRLAAPSRPLFLLSKPFQLRTFAATTMRAAAAVVDSHFISQITAAEKSLTKQDNPVKDGPTARAQSHVGQPLTSQIIHDITMAERNITGRDGPTRNGPTAVAQSFLTPSGSGNTSASASGNTNTNSTSNTTANSKGPASGILDGATISQITEKEKQLTDSEDPVQGGPTARAQQHAGEPITSQALHDITEGEKKVTGGERVKGGPTAAAQSVLGRSRS